MYKFVYYKNIVFALSSFGGKTVKGTAKCDPNDAYSREYGEKLAQARCNTKVSKKRVKWATLKLAQAKKDLARAQVRVGKMEDYVADALQMEMNAKTEEEAILKEAL